MRVAALVLAAGAGRRMGQAKALVQAPDGTPWVVQVVRAAHAAGCAPVLVVTGAAGEQVRSVLRAERVEPVAAADWAEGMGASLRVGLRHLMAGPPVDAALILLVDTPDVGEPVLTRLREQASPMALLRATYAGRPGHPVLIGAAHFAGVLAAAHGDVGARDYLRRQQVGEVDCSDLADGLDVDDPSRLPLGHHLARGGGVGGDALSERERRDRAAPGSGRTAPTAG